MLGRFLRGIHYFGASAMVLLVGDSRVARLLMAAYKFPREINWLSGAVLLLMTWRSPLPDSCCDRIRTRCGRSSCAAQAGRMPVVGRDLARFILAGDTIGGATLSASSPFTCSSFRRWSSCSLACTSTWSCATASRSGPRRASRWTSATYRARYEEMLHREGVPFWPDAAWRDVVFGASMVAVVVLLALIVGPPDLGRPP